MSRSVTDLPWYLLCGPLVTSSIRPSNFGVVPIHDGGIQSGTRSLTSCNSIIGLDSMRALERTEIQNEGIEPSCPKAAVFETAVYTYSTSSVRLRRFSLVSESTPLITAPINIPRRSRPLRLHLNRLLPVTDLCNRRVYQFRHRPVSGASRIRTHKITTQ